MSDKDELKRLAERITYLERAFQVLAEGIHAGGIEWGKKGVSSTEQQLYDLAISLDAWASHHEKQQVATLEVLSALTRELADSGSETTQVLPVTVFLDTHRVSDTQEVSRAIRSFLATLDLDLFFEGSGEWGSWFSRSFARSKRALKSQGVKDTLTRAERALEMQTLHIPQAQIDAMQADAAARLITALSPTPNAIVQIGSVLLVKVDDTTIVRNLTQIELSYLEHNKHLYKSPKDALEELARISGDPNRFIPPGKGQIPASGQDASAGS